MANSNPFNALARVAAAFKAECKKIDMDQWLSRCPVRPDEINEEASDEASDDLSSLMQGFKEVRMADGYVLDGFLTGLDGFGYSFHLHARRADAVEFVPPEWKVVLHRLPEEERLARMDRWSQFRDNMYIRHGVLDDELRYFDNVPMWSSIKVPFTERGIWEATLLLIAPHMLPCFWHAYYQAYEIICSDSNLSKRAPRSKYIGTEITHPQVVINSEEATVLFTEWGWNGLRQHLLDVRRDGDSVRFIRDIATYLDLQKEIRYL